MPRYSDEIIDDPYRDYDYSGDKGGVGKAYKGRNEQNYRNGVVDQAVEDLGRSSLPCFKYTIHTVVTKSAFGFLVTQPLSKIGL